MRNFNKSCYRHRHTLNDSNDRKLSRNMIKYANASLWFTHAAFKWLFLSGWQLRIGTLAAEVVDGAASLPETYPDGLYFCMVTGRYPTETWSSSSRWHTGGEQLLQHYEATTDAFVQQVANVANSLALSKGFHSTQMKLHAINLPHSPFSPLSSRSHRHVWPQQ